MAASTADPPAFNILLPASAAKGLAAEIIEGFEPTDNAPPKRAATQSKGSFKKSTSKKPHRKNHTPRDARSSSSEGGRKRNSRNRRR